MGTCPHFLRDAHAQQVLGHLLLFFDLINPFLAEEIFNFILLTLEKLFFRLSRLELKLLFDYKLRFSDF